MQEVEDILVDALLTVAEWARRKRFMNWVRCAYCNGTGIAWVNGHTCRCPVCSAAGKVEVTPPVVTCLRCAGSGREKATLTCLACRGLGAVPVAMETAACAECRGTGDEGLLYCIPCKGQGIV